MDDDTPNRRSKWESYDVEEELRAIDKKALEVRCVVDRTRSGGSSSPLHSIPGLGILLSMLSLSCPLFMR